MRMPTIIKAAVVTDVVNKDRINGEMKIDKINSMPITMAVRPVFDPPYTCCAFNICSDSACTEYWTYNSTQCGG